MHQFYKGICLFCGNKAAVKFFPGRPDKYRVCKCEGSAAHQEAKNALHRAEQDARKRLRSLELEDEINEAALRLSKLQGEAIRRSEHG